MIKDFADLGAAMAARPGAPLNAHFDAHSHQHSHQHSEQSLARGPAPPRRIEIFTGAERRRRWSREEKARITAESFEPGANVSGVARRNGVSLGVLHHWRRRCREVEDKAALRFIPVHAAAQEVGGEPAPLAQGLIEIEMEAMRVRVSGAVDAATLRLVLSVAREVR